MSTLTDPFTNHELAVSRLVNDYFKYGNLTIGCDFDNTIHDYHNTGATYPVVEQLLRDCYAERFNICIYSCNPDVRLIHETITALGIDTYHLNYSPLKAVSKPWKPFFSILLDDRAGLQSAVTILQDTLQQIKQYEG